jgi:hypothetical protein
MVTGQQTVRVVMVGDDTYFRGNAQYWIAHKTPISMVALLSRHWLRQRATTKETASFRPLTHRDTLARCVVRSGAGTMTVASGSTRVDGLPAVVLREAGDRPGSAPGLLYLAAGSSALPLRATQTAPQRPGGKPDSLCGQTAASDHPERSGTITFGSYDVPMHIEPPPAALTAAQLRASARNIAARTIQAIGPASSAQRTQDHALVGTWSASGRMVHAQNYPGEPTGTLFPGRVWVIQNVCTARLCRPFFTRSSAQGPLVAPLIWKGDHWTASFTEPLGCPTTAGSMSYQTSWSFRFEGPTLTAVERGSARSDCSPPLSALATWSARRVGSPVTAAA